MNKYKEDYYIYKNKDIKGNIVNKDDTYIQHKNRTQIYRFNDNILIVQFFTKGFANNRIKELSELGVQLTPFQIGDNECTFKFTEDFFPIVVTVVKAKKRIKRDLTDEQRKVIKERLINSHKK